MNKDIETMIELQRFWDNILRAENNIKKNNESVTYWEKELQTRKTNVHSLKMI